MQGHLVILSFVLLVLLFTAMSYAGLMVFRSNLILRHHPLLRHRHHHYQQNNRDFRKNYNANGSE
ncbi:MAG: hypothetical protein HF314_16765 [Ignavibacteria bacterium]|nr:hypothetical protein [Ignavibacteria bacterium]MCU7504737.1 hypothetical protein [Ignavibacteria bacterium]MCU7516339.1 hypothetical protein [Ignavibacteria bacterium]